VLVAEQRRVAALLHGVKSKIKWQGAYGIHDQYGIEIYCTSS
jgi:hypothetical protein